MAVTVRVIYCTAAQMRKKKKRKEETGGVEKRFALDLKILHKMCS